MQNQESQVQTEDCGLVFCYLSVSISHPISFASFSWLVSRLRDF